VLRLLGGASRCVWFCEASKRNVPAGLMMRYLGEELIVPSRKTSIIDRRFVLGDEPLVLEDCAPETAGTHGPKVAILLCTYNGQKYLSEQLDSCAAQDYSNWCVWASDDGSNDETLKILSKYQAEWGPDRLSIQAGPGKGFAANFLSLTTNAGIDADMFAYSDQDDVWERDKLSRAVAWLSKVPSDVPGLYCSRTLFVDEENRRLGLSKFYKRAPSFANALTQNLAGGNTMVFNKTASALLRRTPQKEALVPHDWWAYILISGCGGQLFYDEHPSLRYRQHRDNALGARISPLEHLARIKRLWSGEARRWCDIHLDALDGFSSDLTQENRQVLNAFIEARRSSWWSRPLMLRHAGVYRQTLIGNIGLYVAAALGKI